MSEKRPTVSAAARESAPLPEAGWAALMPDEQWSLFTKGVDALERAGVTPLLHGALGLATYTGRWRNTKDVDVIVRSAERERAIAALRGCGFEDYYEREAYDRSWIFRGFKDDVIFDIIWALPNHRVEIDEPWFQRAQPITLRGRKLATVPPEELIRAKLYVFQRHRCDWVDVLNVTAGAVDRIDWKWLVQRMGRDLPLLHGMLAVFNWLSPQRAKKLPPWLREQFALAAIDGADEPMEVRHAALFDSRPWFALHQPADQILQR